MNRCQERKSFFFSSFFFCAEARSEKRKREFFPVSSFSFFPSRFSLYSWVAFAAAAAAVFKRSQLVSHSNNNKNNEKTEFGSEKKNKKKKHPSFPFSPRAFAGEKKRRKKKRTRAGDNDPQSRIVQRFHFLNHCQGGSKQFSFLSLGAEAEVKRKEKWGGVGGWFFFHFSFLSFLQGFHWGFFIGCCCCCCV
eukprot:TRINITY_DN1914_c1_g1_i2.p1 TRINITY_DN1914_c1_g1~~TRINITY_DN1914_c1_g1_i2.p1  ORF type:complete len:192 (+),score=20.52 TRINITY_DN1914_c1_g1_i2:924-1499(+)